MTKSLIVSIGLLCLLVLSFGPPLGLAAQTRLETSGATFTGLIVDREGVIKPATFSALLPTAAAPDPQPNIDVKGYFSNDKAPRGRTFQVGVVIEIPSGYHVNANRPLGKYAIPTTLKVEGPRGVTVGAVAYPRAIVRKLKAVNNEPLAVYENRAILRFNVTVPANYQGGSVGLKASLRYQSCNDEVCFPPKNQNLDMGIDVVGAGDRVQKVNGWVFGGR